MDIENFIKKLSVKKIIVGSVGIFFGFLILREIVAVIFLHSLFGTVNNQFNDQKMEMRQFHQETKKEMNQINNGMNHEIQEVQKGVDEMQKKMNELKAEFSGAEKVEMNIANSFPEVKERAKENSRWAQEQSHDFSIKSKQHSDKFFNSMKAEHKN